MFESNERLKRLEVENKLADALERLANLRNELHEKVEEAMRVRNLDNHILKTKLEETNRKLREQTEADILTVSFKLIKALVVDEKPKEDSYVRSLLDTQRNAYNTLQQIAPGRIVGLGELFR